MVIRRRTTERLALFFGLLSYSALILLGHQFSYPLGSIPEGFSPGSGVAVAIFCRWGIRFWPLIFLCDLAGHAPYLWGTYGILPSLGISMGATVEPLFAAILVLRFCSNPRFPFGNTSDVVRFDGLISPIACLAGALIPTWTRWASGISFPEGPFYGTLIWWLGDIAGMTLTAPLLLTWFRDIDRVRPGVSSRRTLEAACVLFASFAVSFFAFSGVLKLNDSLYFLLTVLLFPILIWATLRFSVRGVFPCLFVIACVASWGSSLGYGPFASDSHVSSIIAFQVFLWLLTFTGSVHASLVLERQKMERALQNEGVRMEAALRERTALLKREVEEKKEERDFRELILNTTGASIIVLDRQGRVVRFNRACEIISGYRAEEVLGATIWDTLILPEERASVLHEFEELRSGNFPRRYECSWRAKDGSIRWILWTSSCLLGPDGRVQLVVGTGIDLTERKRAEAALKTAELDLRQKDDQLGLALQAGKMGGWFWSIGDGSLRWFGNSTELFGVIRSSEIETYDQFISMVVPEDQERIRKLTMEAIESRLLTPISAEYRIRRPSGEVRWMVSVGRLLQLQDEGGKQSMAGIIMDITDRKRMEDERARLLFESQRAVQLSEEFISIASHELKTPLTPLKLQHEILKRSLLEQAGPRIDSERLRKILEISDKQINRLLSLVDDLLSVSKIRAGRMSIQLEDVDLSHVVQETVERFGSQIVIYKGKVELDLEPGIVGRWDRSRLEQVMTNLLTNAMKYGRGKSIRIRVARDDGEGILSVRDEGIGIHPDDQQRIFKRFERAASSTEFGGLGLGLYISAQIVRALGGRIELDSQLGKGSTFIVRLPLRDIDRKAQEKAA